MKYFKNLELASIYHVSEKSVRNWIDGAEKGKNSLELHESDGRLFIANTTKNQLLIEGLVKKGQKYRNSRGHKVVSPSPEFYQLYTEKQVLDIMMNIDTHREIPLEYSYNDEGAHFWDKYQQKLLRETAPNMLNQTIALLIDNYPHMKTQAQTKSINVIDLGVGNGFPVRPILEKLSSEKLLKKYIGVDISNDMIQVAKRNIESWVGKEVALEWHTRNMAYEKFEDLLVKDAFGVGDDAQVNIIFLLGGTLSNLRLPEHALRVINSSMGRNDLFVFATKLDSKNSRRFFDIDVDSQRQSLSLHFSLTLDLLNIDRSFYDVEQFFDKEKHARFVRIKLKVDLTIEFEIGGHIKHLELKKNEYILLWRYWHQSAVDIINQFDRAGFNLLQAAKTPNQEYLLTISRIKTRQ